jgi:ATP-binding cassette, subfamily F, member 3
MITLKNIILRRGTKVLLDQVNITMNPGERVGLVGRNGAGKSTLFALLNGSLHEDGGEFSYPKQWQKAEVAQNMPETEEGATDFVVAGDTRLMAVRETLVAAEAAHDDGGHDDHGMAIAQAYSDLADAGDHDAVPRAQALILGLGFKSSELNNPVNSFSGGWRMRLQLARALMCPSDLLLLDEPTNHLDLDALVWLEAWLKKYAGTMIVISHDREFLDSVTQVTVHIDNQQLTRYGSNYSAFEILRSQQLELQQAAFSKQQDKIAHLQKFIDRFKAKASKAKQAQSRVKALERMEKVAPMLASADFNFEFKEPANLPNPMLSISDGVFGYLPGAKAELDDTGLNGAGGTTPAAESKIILRSINRSVLAGQRIGILGANGQGKSTLVKTIARDIPLISGMVTEGKGLSIGYFAQQELDVLRPADNPLEHMVRLAREVGPAARGEQELRGFLGSFNFGGDMVKQSVGSMSGGEKARLVLAMMVWQRPNLLLMDEPTNHLDLVTREALAMALNEFEGTVMLVSHDRALLRSVCDEFWLVGRGGIEPFDGDLDDYQQYLLDESKRLRELANAKETPTIAPLKIAAPAALVSTDGTFNLKNKTGKVPQKHQRDLDDAQTRLDELHAEKSALEALLAQALKPLEIADTGRRLKQVTDALGTAEERWLAVSEQIESAMYS